MSWLTALSRPAVQAGSAANVCWAGASMPCGTRGERRRDEESHTFEFCQLESSDGVG